MASRATRWLVGGVLAAATGLVSTVPSALLPGGPPAGAVAAVRVAPSDDTGVTFEVVPASPTITPTTPPPTRQPTPTPSHGGNLPVTGPNGSILLLVAVGMTLVVIGWLAARRRRPS
ncbi:LPXTG cell wall anchor domain-containing protein [Micromonospora sp. NPDC049801]|uniref:LPXTG cell wall anchor domain-containing protein n=1 Tax=unclassified Micromonospora TaxID=2617518 RepID=UPI0033D79C4D